MKFKVTFAHDTDGVYLHEFESYDARDAAEEFSKYAYVDDECPSLRGPWTGDDAIVVVDEKGERTVWRIDVEFVPSFSATCFQEPR